MRQPMRGAALVVGVAAVAMTVVAGSQAQAEAGVQERLVFDRSTTVASPVGVDAVTVEGRTRSTDARYYDVDLLVAGQRIPTVTIFTTDARNRPSVRHVLLSGAGSLATVDVAMSYAYDTSDRVCPVGLGGACAAWLPVDGDVGSVSIDWTDAFPVPQYNGSLTPNRNAEIVVRARITVDGQVVDAGTVRIPYVGQLLAVAG